MAKGWSNPHAEEGAISKWNEGTLFSLRLHEAKEIMNYAKMNPLGRTNNQWNYNLWISAIDILGDEGSSKYSDEENEHIARLKKLIRSHQEVFHVHTIKIDRTTYNKKQIAIINHDNWKKLRDLIELYEANVKLFNDIHGLSTQNMGDDDDGL